MAKEKVVWRQFPDYSVSTNTQHLPTKVIRWIRNNKSGQMLYVRDKDIDSDTKVADVEEEEDEPTT
eukprot:1183759-Karenia_brevis.AAC.1